MRGKLMHRTMLTQALQFQTPIDKGIVFLRIATHIAILQEICIA